MANTRRRRYKNPRITTDLPPHLHARLHAASTVLHVPVSKFVESALESAFEKLDDDQIELIDRVAATLLVRTDLEQKKR